MGNQPTLNISCLMPATLQHVFHKAMEHFGADAFNLGAYDKKKVPQPCNAQAACLEHLLPISSGEILVLAKGQSCIQGLEEGQWKLIVGCTTKMGSSFAGGHQAAIQELYKDMTKEGMLQKHTSLLRNVPVRRRMSKRWKAIRFHKKGA